ncbi:ankyrin repeat domain-containing protein [Candidatus Finniella inopinata]|nr:ankyrin repeat domain-containing protein [Candidatus Finniella inopinata]
MRAVKSNNIEKALELINDGDDITVRDSYGRSLMHYAQDAGLIEKLKEKMTINDPDLAGCTPLMIAVQSNNAAQAKLLVEKGADVKATNSMSQTALFFAKNKGSIEFLKAKGLSVEDKDVFDKTPLMYAKNDPNFPQDAREALEISSNTSQVSTAVALGGQGQVATATNKPAEVNQEIQKAAPGAAGAASSAPSAIPTVTEDEAQKEKSRREFLSTIKSAARAPKPTALSNFSSTAPTLTPQMKELVNLDKSSMSAFSEITEEDPFWNGGSLENDSKKSEILETWGKIANIRSNYMKKKLGFSDDTKVHNLALRSLGALPLPRPYSLKSEDLMDRIQHCRTKILSTGGAFGIDFERKAQGLELRIMVNSLKDAGRYQAMRYKPDQPKENAPFNLLRMLANDLIDETSPAQLLEHQIVCFIVAAKEAMDCSEPAQVAFRKNLSEGRYEKKHDYEEFAYCQIAEAVQNKVGTERGGRIDEDFVSATFGRINKDIADFTDERVSAH